MRKMTLRFHGLVAAGALPALLAACGGAQTVDPRVPPFEDEIVAYLEDETDADIDRQHLLLGYIDLNGDGGDEAFALYLDEDNCNGSACGGWIFLRRLPGADAAEDDDRPPVTVVGRFASFTLPVASRERVTKGWRDVIVRDPQSGGDDRLRYDGRVYR